MLKSFRFTIVPQEPYYVIKDGIIIFFYINNIIIAYYKTKEVATTGAVNLL